MAPTASVAPEIIDRIWQKASASCDRPRTEIFGRVDSQISKGPFRSHWQSLATHQVSDWYKDAKFGIFIHWGLYCVPAFGSEQYPHAMYTPGTKENKYHIATYGPLTQVGYKDFIPMLTAKDYDPAAWARLFKRAGTRYVIPVFEHHDGFAMYDCGLSDYFWIGHPQVRPYLAQFAAYFYNTTVARGSIGVLNYKLQAEN